MPVLSLACVVSIVLGAAQFWLAALPVQARNTIEGRVTNSSGHPLSEMRVFVKDEGYAQAGTALTDGTGRFRFTNLKSGNYIVEVEPGATGYERQEQRVQAKAFNERRSGGGEVFRVEFVLVAKKSGTRVSRDPDAGSNIIFRQDVPEDAKRAYDRGVRSLEKGSFDDGIRFLKLAIQVFPEYYDALERLGTEYVTHQDPRSALPLLTLAVELNRDGWRGFYSLGIAQFKSDNRSASIKSFQRAMELNSGSANTNMWLGIALAPDPNMRSRAIQVLENAIRLAKQPIPLAYYYLGGLYSKNKQYREAADAFESLLRVNPQLEEKEAINRMIKDLREKAKAQAH
ncbi:MAG TPA: tetratricopeptide repeat protein [Blastocatellia bacterium]|nr:tetratricopeptide repeat protein [Blastocatellia bacterium]